MYNQFIYFLINKIVLVFIFFFQKLYNFYIIFKNNNISIQSKLYNIILLFLKIYFFYLYYLIFLFKNTNLLLYIYILESFKIVKNKILLYNNNILFLKYKNLKNIFILLYCCWYFLKILKNINKYYIFKFINIFKYIFNIFYLYLKFYYNIFIRYIRYIYNIFKIRLLNLISKLNFISNFKEFNYNQFLMRLSYSRVKYWYDYKDYSDRFKDWKKYIKNLLIFYNNKLLFKFIELNINKIYYYIFLFFRKVLSILIFIKDSIYMFIIRIKYGR